MTKNWSFLSMVVLCHWKVHGKEISGSKENCLPHPFPISQNIGPRLKNDLEWVFGKNDCVILHEKAHEKEITKSRQKNNKLTYPIRKLVPVPKLNKNESGENWGCVQCHSLLPFLFISVFHFILLGSIINAWIFSMFVFEAFGSFNYKMRVLSRITVGAIET